MSNFLIALAVFVITVVAALFALPYAVDWNGYRGTFEEEASRMLGRDVRVGGAVSLQFLPTPSFSLERVRIADTTGGLQEPFFRTEGLSIKLAVPPLLRGAIEANEVEFRRPVLRVAVDEKGNWNWQSFISAFRNAAYMPSNVALVSLAVTDGMLALHGPDGQERTRFENIKADLSAPALDGPYRVRAVYGSKGAERDLRLATAKPEADGSVRIKASLRAGDTASTYALDGRVLNLTGKAALEGELTARLPFGGLWPTQNRAVTDDAFELKSPLKADAERLELAGLTLSTEHEGQPQIITGDVSADWRKALEVETKLAARWLDLDRIGGATTVSAPLDSIVPFAQRLRDLLPAAGRSRASLAVEQANIGREAVSGLVLSLTRADDRLSIDELRAGMPGGSRIEMTGVVTGSDQDPRFAGSMYVRGASLARFANWASGGGVPAEGRGDGTFGVRARLDIEHGLAAMRDIAGEVSGNALGGTASFSWGQTSEIALRLEGPQLDARAFIPAGADLSDMVALLSPAAKAPDTGQNFDFSRSDLSLRISTGALITAGTTYRDVTAEIERKGGTLKIPLLRMSGDDGFLLELESQVAGAASQPKGTMRITAAADSAQALKPLAELLGLPVSLRPSETRFQSLAPLRVAGTVAFGARLATSIDFAGDGEANGGSMRVSARFDGGAGGWRSGPADIALSMENPDAAQIAALLLPATGRVAAPAPGVGTVPAPGTAPSPGPAAETAPAAPTAEAGRVLLRAAGVPADGMSTLFSLTANETAVAFSGRFLATPDAPRLTGDLEIAGADGARIAAFAKLAPPLDLGDFRISGTLRIATDGSTVNVERMALNIAGTELRGRLGMAPEGDRQRFNAQLESDALNFADMLAPFLDNRLGSATAVAEAALNERGSVWPDQPFSTRALKGFVGDVSLSAGRLTLARNVALADARASIRMGDGRIEVRQLEGSALGGRWAGAFTLSALNSGAKLTGTLETRDIGLSTIAAGMAGTGAAKASFQASGSSPRALMAALQGQGTIELAEAAIPGPSPATIARAVDASLGVSGDKVVPLLRQGLLAHLAKPPLPLPEAIAFEIADGYLRLKPLGIETQAGTAIGNLQLDVSPLTIASDWRLTDKQLSSKGRELPGISVLYRGSLGMIARIEPEIGSDALEREVSVRKMERDVEELERLRRADETRRREESERLREQAERTPPPQPAPQPPPQQHRAPPQPKEPSLKSLLPPWLAP